MRPPCAPCPSRPNLRATIAPFDRARPLPPSAHRDEAVLAFERAHVFERAWLCAGHESEIPGPGAWLLAPVADEGVIVARGDDGVVRAFHNVCPHRGATLVDAPSGCASRLVCPYHGLAFGLDGARITPDAAFPSSSGSPFPGLSPVRVEALHGFLFVSLDPDALPVASALAGAPPWLAALPPLRLARRARWETRANWKLCVENFQESHHFPCIHPALEALTPCDRAASVLGDGPWLTGIMDLVPSAETVSKSGHLRGRP